MLLFKQGDFKRFHAGKSSCLLHLSVHEEGRGCCRTPSGSAKRTLDELADARKALGIGTTKLYELIGEGHLPTLKLGRRTLIRTESLRAFLAKLEAA